MQVLLFLHRLYFFVILNIRNKKTYKMKKIIFLFIISSQYPDLCSRQRIILSFRSYGHPDQRSPTPNRQGVQLWHFRLLYSPFLFKICTRPASLSADCSEILPFHIQLSAGRTYGLRSNYPAGFAGKTTDFRSARREPAPAKPLLSLQLSIR